MTQLIAFCFDAADAAAMARRRLSAIQDLTIDDAAVIVKEHDGQLKIIHELDRGVRRSVLKGSAIGLLIGGLLAPSAGLVLGGLIGAAAGRRKGLGIAHTQVNHLAKLLPAGKSALIVGVSTEQQEQLCASLHAFGGVPLAVEFF